MTWFWYFFLQLGFFFLVVSIGYAVADQLLKERSPYWIDRVALGVFVICAVFAALGLVITVVPWPVRQLIGGAALLVLGCVAITVFIRQSVHRAIHSASQLEKTFVIGAIVLSGAGLWVSLLPVKLPEPLFDGPYVAKHDYLGVRVQFITGHLPTDNSLPHVASEYLLRDIDFKKERPIMPGQEVSNRPIMVSLFLVPVRAALSLPSPLNADLPRFSYVGQTWPDFSVLMSNDEAFLYSLSLGVVLNAMLLIGVGTVAKRMTESTALAVAVCLLVISSPYFIFQTIFTWPKALAAFFIVLSFLALSDWRRPILAGALLGFGYLSHPYALVFVGGIVMYAGFAYFYRFVKNISGEGRTAASKRNVSAIDVVWMSFAFLTVVAPWFYWTKIVLAIPSDLVQQNFSGTGSLSDFLWVRMANFSNAVLPMHLTVFPFELGSLVKGSSVSIPGAVGTLAFVFGCWYIAEHFWGEEKKRVFFLYVPTLLLILVFSNRALPALHGLQGPIALLVLVSVVQMKEKLGSQAWTVVAALQVVLYSAILALYLVGLVQR